MLAEDFAGDAAMAVNGSKPAREFEFSTRTVKRGLDFMKCRLDLPIEFDARRNGYHFTDSHVRCAYTGRKGFSIANPVLVRTI